jgi:hypothetical protein
MGTLCAYFWGEILPDDKDVETLKKSNSWKIIYGYFPLALYCVTIIGLLLFIK